MEKIKYVRIDCPMIKQEQENFKLLVNDYKQLKNAIIHFEDKIASQGMITNARDEEHLTRLKNEYQKLWYKLSPDTRKHLINLNY